MEITGKVNGLFCMINVNDSGFHVANDTLANIMGKIETSEPISDYIYNGNTYLECVRAFLMQRKTGTLSSDIDLSKPKTLYYYSYADDSRVKFNLHKVVISNNFCDTEKVWYNKSREWLDKFRISNTAYYRKDIFDFIFMIENYLKLNM